MPARNKDVQWKIDIDLKAAQQNIIA